MFLVLFVTVLLSLSAYMGRLFKIPVNVEVCSPFCCNLCVPFFFTLQSWQKAKAENSEEGEDGDL